VSTTDDEEPTGPGFAESLAELEAIVAELESSELEVDHLAGRVERASELVRICRDRLDRARFAVEDVLERTALDED